MVYRSRTAGIVLQYCGPRAYDLPGYYLDAVIAVRDEQVANKKEYDANQAEHARTRRAGKKAQAAQ